MWLFVYLPQYLVDILSENSFSEKTASYWLLTLYYNTKYTWYVYDIYTYNIYIYIYDIYIIYKYKYIYIYIFIYVSINIYIYIYIYINNMYQ